MAFLLLAIFMWKSGDKHQSLSNVEEEENQKEKQKIFSPLMKLPDELILHILSFLSQSDIATKVCLVNKRLKNICLDPTLWTKLKLPKEETLNFQAASAVLNRCTKLKELDLSSERRDKDALVIQALGERSQVVKLKCSIRRADLFHTTSMHNLKHLTMRASRTDFFATVNDLLKAVGTHCQDLTHFEFQSSVSAQGTTALLSSGLSNTLTSLFLGFGDNNIGSESAIQALGQCQHLEQLRINLPVNNLASLALDHISRNLSKLRFLRLSMCEGLTSNDYVQAFSGKKLGNLRELSLWHCSKLEDSGIQAIAYNSPQLIMLSLMGNEKITDIGVKTLLIKCRKLEELEFYFIGKLLTHEAFREVEMPCLKILVLGCVFVSKEDVAEIEMTRPQLKIYHLQRR